MRNFSLKMMIIFFISSTCFAEEEKITIEVDGINAGKGGNLIVLVFGRDGFPIKHEKALSTQVKKVSDSRVTFTFDAPPSDEMAFKVLHDEDSNNRVTKNWTGIWPREGLGFSNGAMLSTLGPPDFDASKILRKDAVSKGIKMRITYP